MTYPVEYKNVRPARSRFRVHVSDAADMRVTLCGRSADGYVLADQSPDCKTCLAALLERLQ